MFLINSIHYLLIFGFQFKWLSHTEVTIYFVNIERTSTPKLGFEHKASRTSIKHLIIASQWPAIHYWFFPLLLFDHKKAKNVCRHCTKSDTIANILFAIIRPRFNFVNKMCKFSCATFFDIKNAHIVENST